ncbi:hypothetical protein [Los Azufres archaeal virus 1]|nr:hypothetical protein [Los Azufres archaeal virus 1]
MVVISGVKNPPPFAQDYSIFSLSSPYPVIDNFRDAAMYMGEVLVETNPLQIIRQRQGHLFILDLYIGVEHPLNPPYTNMFVQKGFKLFHRGKITLSGKEKCYLGRATDQVYVKDGIPIIYVNEPFIAAEEKAYAKRFGKKALLYMKEDISDFLAEQCAEIVPTNPYAEMLLDAYGIAPSNWISLDAKINGVVQTQLKHFVREAELFESVWADILQSKIGIRT